MSNLNVGEIGAIIRVNVGKDITGTMPTLILLPEFGELREITTGVTTPTVEVVEGGDTYYPGEYIEYTTVECDLDYVGRWKKKAKVEYSSTNIEQTNFEKFRVLP